MKGFAGVQSLNKPLSGQDHRSSANFSTKEDFDTFFKTASQFKWSCPQGIVFNIKEDRTAAIDPVVFENITNGSITSVKLSSSLYIADPKHATDSFVVTVEGI